MKAKTFEYIELNDLNLQGDLLNCILEAHDLPSKGMFAGAVFIHSNDLAKYLKINGFDNVQGIDKLNVFIQLE